MSRNKPKDMTIIPGKYERLGFYQLDRNDKEQVLDLIIERYMEKHDLELVKYTPERYAHETWADTPQYSLEKRLDHAYDE